jgi:hypothetical protein
MTLVIMYTMPQPEFDRTGEPTDEDLLIAADTVERLFQQKSTLPAPPSSELEGAQAHVHDWRKTMLAILPCDANTLTATHTPMTADPMPSCCPWSPITVETDEPMETPATCHDDIMPSTEDCAAAIPSCWSPVTARTILDSPEPPTPTSLAEPAAWELEADEELQQQLAYEAWEDLCLEKARQEWEEEMLEDIWKHHEWNPYGQPTQDYVPLSPTS